MADEPEQSNILQKEMGPANFDQSADMQSGVCLQCMHLSVGFTVLWLKNKRSKDSSEIELI